MPWIWNRFSTAKRKLKWRLRSMNLYLVRSDVHYQIMKMDKTNSSSQLPASHRLTCRDPTKMWALLISKLLS